MNDDTRKEVEEIAELKVHQYFDHYLTEVFPVQVHQVIRAHDRDVTAHAALLDVHQKTCAPGKRLRRVLYMIAGASAVVGAVVPFVLPPLLKLLHIT